MLVVKGVRGKNRDMPLEGKRLPMPTMDNTNYSRWLFALIVLLTVIAGLYVSGWIYGALQAVGSILALYFTAWLIQFFLTPLVDLMTRLKVPRVAAVCAVYLALIAVMIPVLAWIGVTVFNQGQHLVQTLAQQGTYEFITRTSTNIETFLKEHGVKQKDIQTFTENWSFSLQHGAVNAGKNLNDLLNQHLNASTLSTSATVFLGFLSKTSTLLLNTIIVLILSFYMTLDGHRLVHRVLSYFPPAVGEVMESFHVIVNRKFGGYLRGQLILAASYGLLTYIIALNFGLQSYSVFIAIFAGVMMLIPFIGTFAAVIPPIIGFVLVHASDFQTGYFILLIVFLFGSQQVVLNVLAPRVLSTAVGMHPLLVVLGLLLGTKIAGPWGAIFGVPVFGVILDTADLIYRRVMERRYGFHPPERTLEDEHDGKDKGKDRNAAHATPGPDMEPGPVPGVPGKDDRPKGRPGRRAAVGAGPLSRAGAVLHPPTRARPGESQDRPA